MSQWTYRWNIGKKVKTACYIWYIEGLEPITIVDAGAQKEHFTNPEFPMKTRMSLEEGLSQINIKPEEIENVIVTHLHFDHIALAYRYENATFIVQKEELEYARNPHIFNSVDYNPQLFEGLSFKIVQGDTELYPGINLLHTPGHSPGGQSVQINTDKGKAIITGFCSQMSTFTQTPFMKEKGLEVAACGLHTDCRIAYDTALRVKNAADIIIPNHDPQYMDIKTIP
ncbi:MAG: N-acyl homoserine lactonase family protein [Desulfobacteraceae bacterium]|nr:N-acyl homoserine lactonase family protein [Desulfobacteraceae bacterium]